MYDYIGVVMFTITAPSDQFLFVEVSEQRLQALRRKAPAIRSKDVTYRVCR